MTVCVSQSSHLQSVGSSHERANHQQLEAAQTPRYGGQLSRGLRPGAAHRVQSGELYAPADPERVGRALRTFDRLSNGGRTVCCAPGPGRLCVCRG